MKITAEEKEKENGMHCLQHGFGAMAALAPQQRQCELGSYYPAGTLVKPLLRQAARTLSEYGIVQIVNQTNTPEMTISHKLSFGKFQRILNTLTYLRNFTTFAP